MRDGRGAARALAAALLLAALAGCSHGSDGRPGKDVSTFKVHSGDCVVPPSEVKAELSVLRVVPCTAAHTQEAYAVVTYASGTVDTGKNAPYPGDSVLKKFADGACAQRYEGYVGVAYPDSSLFFTYLLPSARSWQADDRSVICFVTTTGKTLRRSVKNTKV